MKTYVKIIFILAAIGLAFWTGSRFGREENPENSPQIATSAPIIRQTGTDTDTDTDISSFPPGTVQIVSERQQAIGVRVDAVERKTFTHTLRVLGRVAGDENLVYRLNAAAEGWITDLSPLTVGSAVKKQQPLASYYSRELLTAGQTYLGALAVADRSPEAVSKDAPAQFGVRRVTPPKVALQLATDALRSLGMGDDQIEEMKHTRQIVQHITLTSPASGFVVARNVLPSQWFDRGTELYRIADLSRVWIFADLYENEAQYFRRGMKVKVSLPNQGKPFQAQVSDVLPQFDSVTRTLKLRLEAENPNYAMRPDMFVDVQLPIQLPPAIAIPADAVLDSGLKKTVFVDHGDGIFEPREVETGWRTGGHVEIARGLKPGERIVISGNFLIDSESKLEAAAAGMQAALSKDPVCGLEVSEKKAEKAGRRITWGGVTYIFCSDGCKGKFQKDPDRYVKK